MFKTKAEANVDTDRRRIVHTEFCGIGLGSTALDDVWLIKQNLPTPPPLEMFSTPYTGPTLPKFVYDEKAHAAYIRDNTPRPEPVVEPDWTEDDIKVNLKLTEAQLRIARGRGFPPPTGKRMFFNPEGVPFQSVLTWRPAVVRDWHAAMKTLVGR